MLKLRIIPTLLFNDLKLVKGVSFDSWRSVGSIMQSVRLYNIRKVDELIFLDISATNNKNKIDLELVNEVANECFMPLTFGGGIKTIDDISNLLKAGADKVCINSEATINLEFVKKACKIFGSQCIVISIVLLYLKVELVSITSWLGSKILPSQRLRLPESVSVG